MLIKVTRVDGQVEFFEMNEYRMPAIKDLHPMIIRMDVYSGIKKVFTIRRKFVAWYKKITFNSAAVQDKLRQIDQQMQQMQQPDVQQPETVE